MPLTHVRTSNIACTALKTSAFQPFCKNISIYYFLESSQQSFSYVKPQPPYLLKECTIPEFLQDFNLTCPLQALSLPYLKLSPSLTSLSPQQPFPSSRTRRQLPASSPQPILLTSFKTSTSFTFRRTSTSCTSFKTSTPPHVPMYSCKTCSIPTFKTSCTQPLRKALWWYELYQNAILASCRYPVFVYEISYGLL